MTGNKGQAGRWLIGSARMMACATMLTPVAVIAQTRAFDIPAQPAAQSIPTFARQSGIQMLASARDIRGKTTNAVHGSHEVPKALQSFLKGTGLTAVPAGNSGMMTIRATSMPVRQMVSARAPQNSPASDAGSIAVQEPARPAVETAERTDIVVTGSRVIRDGSQAPTPLTVVGIDDMRNQPRADLADTLNLMPAFSGSMRPQAAPYTISNGTVGVNALNLRRLGVIRTLVLLDGHRSIGTTAEGIVDVSQFPQELVQRVEVVTGGASAAYGSDAVAGAVNFVLDKKFTGLKGELSGGVTTRGDNQGYSLSLTGGTSFADGRGHFLISGQLSAKDELRGSARDWMGAGRLTIQNPAYTATNGQPQYLFTDQVGPNRNIPGGLILDTALRGVSFGAGGVPQPFNFGAGLPGGGYMSGGDWQSIKDIRIGSLDPQIERRNIFTRLSYDVTDDIQVYGQFSYSRTHTANDGGWAYATSTFNIRQDNAFLPDEIRQRMVDLNLSQFTLGALPQDLVTNDQFNMIASENWRRTRRALVGATGKFDALGTNWDWEVFYQSSLARTKEITWNNPISANFSRAIDAVRDPRTGAIVCRSTLTNPANGCVPYNLMGIGMNSDAAIAYVVGSGVREQRFQHDNGGFSLSGDILSLPAGNVALAFGGEWRREQSDGSPGISGLFTANNNPTIGQYDVTEGFAEIVIPVLRDSPVGKMLELNGAARLTHYSTSGSVATWKFGASYTMVDGVRFRGTISRDIRAPNLFELMAGETTGNTNTRNPFRDNIVFAIPSIQRGNPNLAPEKALTTGVGVVLQPAALSGFTASVDYWNIDLKDSIGSLNSQQIVDQCFLGQQAICDLIDMTPGGDIASVSILPINIGQSVYRGIDYELGYRLPLDRLFSGVGGNLSIRALATNYLKAYSNNNITPALDTVGSLGTNGGPPDWQFNLSVTYDNGPFKFNLNANGFTSGTSNNDWVACASNCPASTLDNPTININHVPGEVYFGSNVAYTVAGAEFFFSVQNMFNLTPRTFQDLRNVVPSSPATNPVFFDTIGRAFRAGVRFKL